MALRERAGLLELLRPCFARTLAWLQAGKYVAALGGELPRVNGWPSPGMPGTGHRTRRSGC
jgi:hypothetical protein